MDGSRKKFEAGEMVFVLEPGNPYHMRSGKFVRYDKNKSGVIFIDFKEIYILHANIKRLH